MNVDRTVYGHSSSTGTPDAKENQTRVYNLLSAKTIQRPQLTFKTKPDNTYNPFIPIIKDKPHSIKPLALLPETDDDGNTFYGHPYEVELEKFEPPDSLLQRVEPEV